MSHTAGLDYQSFAKWGFLVGFSLLLIGAGGELIGHAFFEPMPAWENTLFLSAEVIGIVLSFFSPIVFGIALPLIE